jgi:lipoyl(octanoyl) transferase
MIPTVSAASVHPTECRLFIDLPASGSWNMAVDEALLIDAAENGIAALRFYRWSEPTLSLGYFQRHDDRNKHPPSRSCQVVRRQTGGGAILHDCELTYSLALPTTHRLARQSETLYAAAHKAFIAILQAALAAGSPRWALRQLEPESTSLAGAEPFLCFQRRARGDVLLIADDRATPASWKVLGSAQRRHRGAILQHGSLLLEKSQAAPELPGIHDLTGARLDAAQLAQDISVRLAEDLALRFHESRLSPELELKTAKLANHKYGVSGWTIRR